jgi:hypothetical protein
VRRNRAELDRFMVQAPWTGNAERPRLDSPRRDRHAICAVAHEGISSAAIIPMQEWSTPTRIVS